MIDVQNHRKGFRIEFTLLCFHGKEEVNEADKLSLDPSSLISVAQTAQVVSANCSAGEPT